jgi:hypothetical protein
LQTGTIENKEEEETKDERVLRCDENRYGAIRKIREKVSSK